MKRTLFKYFVELTGHPVSSSLLKFISGSKVSKPLIRPFASAYRINEGEAEYPLETYESLQAYFTRNLKEGIRPVDSSPNALVSPVDGCLSACGRIQDDQSFLIKDHLYSINDILGDEKVASAYKSGFYYIFYLSPSHYHHFHYPIDGTLITRYALGGVSFPVNDLGQRLGDRPFATNQRLISEMDTDHGKIAIVKVGALNVNSIQIRDSSKECKKGEEFGFFSFGSTVILFVEGHKGFHPSLQPGTEVRVGEAVGHWNIS